jgi:hypothetical protein
MSECNHCWEADESGVRCCTFCGVTDERDRTAQQIDEFERSTGDGAYEWSIPSEPDPGRNFRLFVSIETEVSRLVHLEECPVTSANPSARRMEVEDPSLRRSVVVTLDEARWLLATLPKAIAKVEAAWAGDEEST